MAGEIRSLEHPTLKVPYELLNKKFRAAQKSIDRDIASVSSSTRELNAQTERGEDMAVEEVVKTLDVVSQKLASLKRRAGDALSEEERHLDQLTTRFSYLKSFASRDMSDVAQRVWKRQRLDRVLTDHLFRTGHYRTALALARGSDLGPLVDTDLYRMAQKIEDALLQHDTSPCLAWCAENKSKLKKIRSCLEFRVRVQDFIEMIKADKRMEAIRYARKYLSNVEPELIAEFQEAMALLAFSLDTKCMKYRKLFSDERWKELVELFRSENFAMHQLNHHSMLSATLQAGLSALKTPQCYSSESYNLQCPVCSKVFNKLADPLPFSHHAQSQLICAMSGEPINEHNPPMALPNGYIYGENALQKMAEENEGRITCLHTHEVFSIDAARKVFVM